MVPKLTFRDRIEYWATNLRHPVDAFTSWCAMRFIEKHRLELRFPAPENVEPWHGQGGGYLEVFNR